MPYKHVNNWILDGCDGSLVNMDNLDIMDNMVKWLFTIDESRIWAGWPCRAEATKAAPL